MKKYLFFLVFTFLSFYANAVDLTSKGKTFIESLVEVAEYSKGNSGVVSEESQRKVKKVSDQIDFRTVAQKALGKKWSSIKEGDKKEFLNVLQELLETVAYPRAQKISTDLKNMDFKSAGANQVRVSGQLNREKRGEIISEKFDLVLIYNTAGTKIVDVIFGGEKISANLNRQFTEALKKKTFPEIIAQMKKRVNDAKAKKDSAV